MSSVKAIVRRMQVSPTYKVKHAWRVHPPLRVSQEHWWYYLSKKDPKLMNCWLLWILRKAAECLFDLSFIALVYQFDLRVTTFLTNQVQSWCWWELRRRNYKYVSSICTVANIWTRKRGVFVGWYGPNPLLFFITMKKKWNFRHKSSPVINPVSFIS